MPILQIEISFGKRKKWRKKPNVEHHEIVLSTIWNFNRNTKSVISFWWMWFVVFMSTFFHAKCIEGLLGTDRMMNERCVAFSKICILQAITIACSSSNDHFAEIARAKNTNCVRWFAAILNGCSLLFGKSIVMTIGWINDISHFIGIFGIPETFADFLNV